MKAPFGAFKKKALLKYYVFGNIMENGAFDPWSKCSIFHNIFKSIQNFA